MVTEILVWALVLREQPKQVVQIYATEIACRNDAREATRLAPEIPLICVPRHSMERPRR
jgi:hypothetical protein